MTTETYDARRDPDVILLSPFYTDEFVGSRALAYIRKSDHLPTLRELDIINNPDLDPLCPVKLFNPAYRCWLAAYDPDEQIGWGVGEMMQRHGPCREAGTIDLRELASTRGPIGFLLERDLYYTPRRFGDILEHGEDD